MNLRPKELCFFAFFCQGGNLEDWRKRQGRPSLKVHWSAAEGFVTAGPVRMQHGIIKHCNTVQ